MSLVVMTKRKTGFRDFFVLNGRAAPGAQLPANRRDERDRSANKPPLGQGRLPPRLCENAIFGTMIESNCEPAVCELFGALDAAAPSGGPYRLDERLRRQIGCRRAPRQESSRRGRPGSRQVPEKECQRPRLVLAFAGVTPAREFRRVDERGPPGAGGPRCA